jgi:hypothetical protein
VVSGPFATIKLMGVARFRTRPCEKTIAADHWAISRRCAGLWQDEDFGYAIPKAIGLLVFVLDGD